MTDFSIIIPVYNVEKYVSRAVESVLKQNYENMEIILVDDASTDSSGKICDELAAADNRIKTIFKESNGYVGAARNDGVKASSGKYIYFLDADDRLCEGVLSRVAGKIGEGYEVISSKYHCTAKENGRTHTVVCKGNQPLNTRIAAFSPFVGQSFYRREFLLKNERPFDENRMLAEDRKWIVENLAFAERMALEDYPFYLYTQRREGSLLNVIHAAYLPYSLKEVKNLYENIGGMNYKEAAVLKRKLADHYLTLAACAAIVRDKKARAALMEQVKGDMAVLTSKDCLARPFMWLRFFVGTANLLKLCNAVFLHYKTDI